MKENLNPFAIAQAQLDEAAQVLQLDPDMHAFLREPMREFHFTIPVRMDDGSTRTFQGFRVQYNDARGPAKGGIRFHPDETIDTVRALAAWMTWKTAVSDIPLGGGKGGVICNPREMSQEELERLSRGYMRNIARYVGLTQDVPAPDVNTNPRVMAWMLDEYETITGKRAPGVITGKPLELGGSAGRTPATALGGLFTIREAAKLKGLNLQGATAAVQGYGNVGSYAHILGQKQFGLKVVAVSDEFGGIYNANGLDCDVVLEHLRQTGKVINCPSTEDITNEELLALECDILMPAALGGQIHMQNVHDVKAKLIVEAANGPISPAADDILRENDIVVIPDILANAGGVTVSYFEWVQNIENQQWNLEEINIKLCKKMHNAVDRVVTQWKKIQATKAENENNTDNQKMDIITDLRTAALVLAIEKIANVTLERGIWP